MSKKKQVEAEGIGQPAAEDPNVDPTLESILAEAHEQLQGLAPAEEAAPAEPAPPAQEPVGSEATAWASTVIPEDADVNGFFKGKPVSEVLKSYSHAEKKIQELGHELNQVRMEMAAKLAAGEFIGNMLKKPEPPPAQEEYPDPVLDPKGYSDKIRALNEQRTVELIAQRENEAGERIRTKAELDYKYQIAKAAMLQARSAMPEMDDTRFDKVARALIMEVRDNPEVYEGGLLSAVSFTKAYNGMFGDLPPRTEQQAPPVPQQVFQEKQDPPGFGRSAPRQGSGTKVPSLRREQEDIVDRIARTMLSGAGIEGEQQELARNEIMQDAALRFSSVGR